MSATPEAPWVIHLTNGTRRLAVNAELEVEGVHLEPLHRGTSEGKPVFIFIPWHMVFAVFRYSEAEVQAALEAADIAAHDGYQVHVPEFVR